MADYLDRLLGLFGGGQPANTTTLAPPLASYPSSSDADYANAQGFAQGNIRENYLNNQMAHVLGHDMDLSQFQNVKKGGKPVNVPNIFVPSQASGPISGIAQDFYNPQRSKDVDLTKPNNSSLQGQLDQLMMRGALAANRNPVASLGFDPSRVMVDALMGDKGTLDGFYSPAGDVIYSTTTEADPSSLVHESAHRGIQKLRDTHPNEVRDIMNHLPPEENVVRYMMASQAGDPEKNATGEINAQQRQSSIDMFNPEKYGSVADNYRTQLNKLQELAINEMKNHSRRFGPQ